MHNTVFIKSNTFRPFFIMTDETGAEILKYSQRTLTTVCGSCGTPLSTPHNTVCGVDNGEPQLSQT